MNTAVHTSTSVHRCRDDIPGTSAICLTTQAAAASGSAIRRRSRPRRAGRAEGRVGSVAGGGACG